MGPAPQRWLVQQPAEHVDQLLVQRLRCSDPDDQCFIDLAVARRTPWLVTRDHALRRLARRAGAFGVAVLTPEAWARAQTQALFPTA